MLGGHVACCIRHALRCTNRACRYVSCPKRAFMRAGGARARVVAAHVVRHAEAVDKQRVSASEVGGRARRGEDLQPRRRGHVRAVGVAVQVRRCVPAHGVSGARCKQMLRATCQVCGLHCVCAVTDPTALPKSPLPAAACGMPSTMRALYVVSTLHGVREAARCMRGCSA